MFNKLSKIIKAEHANTHNLLELERQKSIEGDEVLELKLDCLEEQVDTLRGGVLSIQGRQFKEDCRFLLQKNHSITLEEYEDIEKDHNAYNKMGGNHNGDTLFAMVEAKYKQSLHNQQ